MHKHNHEHICSIPFPFYCIVSLPVRSILKIKVPSNFSSSTIWWHSVFKNPSRSATILWPHSCCTLANEVWYRNLWLRRFSSCKYCKTCEQYPPHMLQNLNLDISLWVFKCTRKRKVVLKNNLGIFYIDTTWYRGCNTGINTECLTI